jgi:alpha-ketoglutarate-dependent taurine dioxygenase
MMSKMMGKRQLVSLVSPESFVTTGYLEPGVTLPLVIKPRVTGMNLSQWAANSRTYIESQLVTHGAILFRNFGLSKPEDLDQFIRASTGEPIKYQERSSPRSEVSDRIYTSTDYPPSESIFPHNEHSYNRTFPLKIFFFCCVPSDTGGETPIADTRKILKRIDPGIIDRFWRKGYMYVRNFGDGFGVSWQTAFQQTEKAAVEAYCRRNDIECQWKDHDRLKTSQVRRAIGVHPRSGEAVWFNHATFFHVSTLRSGLRDSLMSQFEAAELPNNTFYGDGSPIEPWVLENLREAYLNELVVFPWQQGDVLMLDNMLTSHARRPYTGNRRVLVGMAEPTNWDDLETWTASIGSIQEQEQEQTAGAGKGTISCS